MCHDKLPTLCKNPTAADKRMHYYRLVLWRRREMKRLEAWLLEVDGSGERLASPLARACKMATDTLAVVM